LVGRPIIGPDGKAASQADVLPLIVRKAPQFDDVKQHIVMINFKLVGGPPMTATHLFNRLAPGAPYDRGGDIFRKVSAKSSSFELTAYLMDDDRVPALDALRDTLVATSKELNDGNIYRHFYTRKL
jgi:hypothetical protein